jgi:uncharacterized protein
MHHRPSLLAPVTRRGLRPALLLSLAWTGCPLAAVTQSVAPPPPTAAATAALGSAPVCPETGIPEYAKPLVVDMPAAERGDLELALEDGLVAVRYDCNQLAVVTDCGAGGSYGFAAFNQKEQVVKLSSEMDVKANLPISGGAIGAKLAGEFARGRSLDVAMMMVGKQRTTRAWLTRGDLVEARPGACSEATHFIRGATVGAFALDTAANAEVRGTAQVFGVPGVGKIGAGAGTSSSSEMRSKDGSLEACASASKQDLSPPADCSALLRLELTVIDPEGAPAPAPRDEQTASLCAGELVFAGGKCTSPVAAVPHLCKPDDVTDCRAQCDAGDPGSCSRMGFYHQTGQNGVKRDPAQAAALYQTACDGGWAIGCSSLGALKVMGEGVPQDPVGGAALVEQACDMGMAEMCSFLGSMLYMGNMVPKDVGQGANLLQRGCYGGAPSGCFLLGEVHRKGLAGRTANGATARDLYGKGCEGGDVMSCYALGIAWEDGVGGAKDPVRGRALIQWSCDAGFKPACEGLR